MKYWFVSYAMFNEHFNPSIANILLAFDKDYFPISQAAEKISDVCFCDTRIAILSFQEISEDCFIEEKTRKNKKEKQWLNITVP
ncbi:MAG: hypothetical protein WC473_05065 [Patescibacteria group bacterium]|jgi:hypothetical protein